MTDAMRIVDESELTPEQREYARERDALRRAHTSYAGGNRMSIEEMRRLVAESDEMQRIATAYTRQVEQERREQARQAAAEKADRERQELETRQAQQKAQLKAYWVAERAIYTESEFDAAWRTDRAALARDVAPADDLEAIKAKKRAELSGL
jgi:hypothetical protein